MKDLERVWAVLVDEPSTWKDQPAIVQAGIVAVIVTANPASRYLGPETNQVSWALVEMIKHVIPGLTNGRAKYVLSLLRAADMYKESEDTPRVYRFTPPADIEALAASYMAKFYPVTVDAQQEFEDELAPAQISPTARCMLAALDGVARQQQREVQALETARGIIDEDPELVPLVHAYLETALNASEAADMPTGNED